MFKHTKYDCNTVHIETINICTNYTYCEKNTHLITDTPFHNER